MTTTDFFQARLDAMIDLRHPLAVLATRMPWSQIESNRCHPHRAVCSELQPAVVAAGHRQVRPAGRLFVPRGGDDYCCYVQQLHRWQSPAW